MRLVGLFKKEIFPSPSPTRPNINWFKKWALDVAPRIGPDFSPEALQWRNDLDVLDWMWQKAFVVIDHNYRAYVERFCSQVALQG